MDLFKVPIKRGTPAGNAFRRRRKFCRPSNDHGFGPTTQKTLCPRVRSRLGWAGIGAVRAQPQSELAGNSKPAVRLARRDPQLRKLFLAGRPAHFEGALLACFVARALRHLRSARQPSPPVAVGHVTGSTQEPYIDPHTLHEVKSLIRGVTVTSGLCVAVISEASVVGLGGGSGWKFRFK